MADQREHVLVHLADPLVDAQGPVGRLSYDRTRPPGSFFFKYSDFWLSSRHGLALDPALPLLPGELHLPSLPGIFLDASPDRWGRTLLQRREQILAQGASRAPRVLGDWECLLGVEDETRMGALRFQRETDGAFLDSQALAVPPATRLRELEAAARAIESGEEADARVRDWIAMLLAPGSSLGGARPKATYLDSKRQLWLAKFPGRLDRRDVGAWEYLFTELAQRVGIDTTAHDLLDLSAAGRTFAARRFDRDQSARRLYCSAMTVTGRSDGEQASYLDITEAVRHYGHPGHIDEDLHKLFSRVVFNVLSGNRDDHLRNHGFFYQSSHLGQGWRLAPAFDLSPSPESPAHALALDDRSTVPDVEVVRGTADWYGLRQSEADEVIRALALPLRDWRQSAAALGIPTEEIETTAGAFSALSSLAPSL